MGSLESRIGRLEERVSAESEAPVGGRDNLWTKVWQLTLDAIARIRRAPIAEDHARYTVGGSRNKAP